MFELESILGSEWFKLHKYFFITNSRLSLNIFIIVYQDILNILNHDSRKFITNNRRHSFIEFKVYFKSLYWWFALGLGNFSSSDLEKIWFVIDPNILKFGYWFHDTILDSHYVSVCFLWKILFQLPLRLPGDNQFSIIIINQTL